jgi:hypothetical protein
MDIETAIALLRSGLEGVRTWNQWRIENKEGIPNLHKARLSGTNLRGVNLRKVDLSNAELEGADLREAILFGTDLRFANLKDAKLGLADLSSADLSHADLRGAHLSLVNFHDVVMTNADLEGAHVMGTIWASLDLSQVKNLSKLRHWASSTVGIDTILKSGGLPDDFLSGCGVPAHFIDDLNLFARSQPPSGFNSCFISFSHEDDEFAERLYGRMKQKGLHVWCALYNMRSSRKIIDQIKEAIRRHDKLVLVLSETSMNSSWVATEILKARQREAKEGRQMLFPIRIVPFDLIKEWECFDADSGMDIAREIRQYHIPDFSEWRVHDKFEAAFQRLFPDLNSPADTAAV